VFDNILIICVGNICRSPTAEVLLKHQLGDTNKIIHSAGLGALVGKNIEPTALEILQEHGITPAQHVARQLTSSMLAEADLILAMEKGQINQISNIAPQARGKSFLLGKWNNNIEIPDPFRKPKPAFEEAYNLIEQSLNEWIKHLQ
tara:strand:- start:6212 stop:6649 length:438 start_codon:yes stop_codon:yes gene_type:complete